MAVISVLALIGFAIMDNVNDRVQALDIPVVAKTQSDRLNEVIPNTLDGSFLFMEIFLSIAVLVLAAMVRIHPIFIPIYIIALIGLIIMSGMMSNIYQEAASTDTLQPYADQMPIMSYTLVYLPLIVSVLGTILMVVMYKSWSSAQ